LVLVRARSYIRWAGLPLEDCANELAAGSLHDLYGADVARGRGLRSRRVLVHRMAGSARRAASSGRVGWVETAPIAVLRFSRSFGYRFPARLWRPLGISWFGGTIARSGARRTGPPPGAPIGIKALTP